MKTASMVLGIIGGAIAIIVALWIIIGGIALFNQGSWDYSSNSAAEFGRNAAGSFFSVFGAMAAISGILGLVGGLIVKRSNVAAGIMMVIAAFLSLVSLFNFVSMILFILGAVFAFVREKPAYPPQPPYPPYPPQPMAPPQA